MGDLLTVFQTYSLPAIIGAALVVGALFVLRNATERAIGAEFDRRAAELNLGLERRSRFEEMILIERYETITDLMARLTRIASDLNRRRHGTEVEGLMRDGDIVPLTEVYELLSSRRHVLTDRFQPLLARMADLLLRLANAPDEATAQQVQQDYMGVQTRLQNELTAAFGLDGIAWGES
jgi:hypothetical protein